MNRGAAVMMRVLSLARGVSAAEPTADQRLLGTLREERRIMFKNPSPARLERPSEDLTPLVGVSRREALLSLGAPDYCTPHRDPTCRHARHTAYFFYPYERPSLQAASAGVAEVTLQAGGGWALEIDWLKDRIGAASWVQQE
jgi:hypothetical protein